MKKILSIFGTRPEAIKMAPLALRLYAEPDCLHKICVTGQHRQMLDQILTFFSIKPDYDLDIMEPDQKSDEVVSKVIVGVGNVLREFEPDFVLIHGDTATTLGSAISCYYNKVKFGHVEAGLRTHDLWSPWPEEGNRTLVTKLASLHFAPTCDAVKNLISEGVSAETIHNVGNTVIDAIKLAEGKISTNHCLVDEMRKKFHFLNKKNTTILVTSHRRENFGGAINLICDAILHLSQSKNLQIVFPVHLNPNISQPVKSRLAGVANIHLIPPQNYEDFVYLMSQSSLILTDSGGIQEEAPSLGKPVLLMRDNTERPEAVRAGTVKLVGSCPKKIFDAVMEILGDPSYFERFCTIPNPYGDGRSSDRITKVITSIIR